ncbi:N-terminal domain of Peptidase_S41 [Massilia sp. PDC64]|nr:S41 family peptidase [Massilia sp. PDC64]SDC29431.1 N-terminal domain of Peptidase_S41 [Massilia sp. PDC64]
MKKKWIVAPCLLLLTAIGANAAPPEPQPGITVDSAMRVQTIDTLVAKLNDHYVFPEKAKQIEAVLRQRQREGKYDAITDGEQLAKQLTDDLAGVVHDKHLMVGFDPGLVPPDREVGPRPTTLAEWERIVPPDVRDRVLASSLGVEKVDRLGPRIGYLEISGFPPPFLVAGKYAAAMDKLADTDGLIVDLRKNHGGTPDGVALLVSYFVDERTRVNDIWERDTGVATQHWTVDKLDGKRYGGKKPVLILTGPETMSAGEDFAYTMQALKRATLIGERTWGGAHPTRPFRLGDHFFAAVPSARTISPITHTNWEGVGVVPDVAATPDKALEMAKDMLQRRLPATN